MPSTATNEAKNTAVSVTNENKNGLTWANAAFSWGDAKGNWANYGVHTSNEAKNTAVTVSNESKN